MLGVWCFDAALAQDPPVTAPADSPTAVAGTLTADGNPVAGVKIAVFSGDTEAGEAISADDGTWRVPLARAEQYSVTLNTGSLPEGVYLVDPERTTLTVPVTEGQSRTLIFQLTTTPPADRIDDSGPPLLNEIVTRGADGLRFGMIIAVSAMGLSLIFGVTGLVNFAQGELVAFGAIVAWYLNAGAGIPLVLAAVLAVVISAVFGMGLDTTLFKPLRRRKLSSIALMVVSIGLSLFLRHLYLLVFGSEPKSYTSYITQTREQFGPLAIAPKEIAIIVTGAVAVTLVAILLQKTRLGTSMRAVADNKDLAESSGIDVERVILYTWALGTALAGLGGVLLGLGDKVEWDGGFKLLLLMFAAVVVGGLGTAYGPVLGGLLLGVAIQISTIWFDVEFKIVFALAAMILMLLIRPQGILGRKERVG